MFQRNARPSCGSGTAEELAFQDDVQDLVAENAISATRAAYILDKAAKAGVQMALRPMPKSAQAKMQ